MPSWPSEYGYCETVADSAPRRTAARASRIPSNPTTATSPRLPAARTASATPERHQVVHGEESVDVPVRAQQILGCQTCLFALVVRRDRLHHLEADRARPL